MANPFMYDDPTLKTTAVLNDAMRNAAQIMGLKNQADYQQEHNRLVGQQQEYMRPYYEAAAQEHQARIPVDRLPFSPTEAINASARLKRETGLTGSIDNFFNTYVHPIAGDNTKFRGDFYDTLSSHGKETVTELLNSVAKEHEAKLIKDQNYANTPQAKRTEEFMNVLYNAPDMSTLAKMTMPDVARFRQTQEANSKAAIQELKSQAWWENVERRIQAQKEINDEKLRIQEKLADERNRLRGESKITNNIGVNPATGKEEYLMNDGSFSGVAPGKKPHDATTLDTKRLSDMISNATEGGKKEPSASDIELIGIEAAKHGYDFKPVTKTTAGRLWDSTDTKWQLVPKTKTDGGGGNANLSTEAGLSDHLKSAGASDAYIKDYIKRARAAGKIK